MRVALPIVAALLIAAPAFAQTRDQPAIDPEKATRAADKAMVEKMLAPVRPELPSREEELFSEVLTVIETEYFDRGVSRAELVEAAIRGMLDYLNMRTERRLGTKGQNALLSRIEHHRLRAHLSGRISGIGVIVRKETPSGAFRIVDVIEGSPATKAGLGVGDRIIAIETLPTTDLSLRGAVPLLRGETGTPVNLQVLPASADSDGPGLQTVAAGANKDRLRQVRVVRGSFRVAQVSALTLDDCTGYLRIPNFGPGVSEASTGAVMQLRTDGVTNLILDLRDNRGGALEEAVGVANLFLEKDASVVQLYSRSERGQTVVTTEPPLYSGDVAVLVDGQTGGAAEVLAAALQANKRGMLIGTRSAGRATAESIYSLSTGAAIRLSTALYRDPAGRTWAGSGLSMEVEVEPQPFGPGDPIDPALSRAKRLLEIAEPCVTTVPTRR